MARSSSHIGHCGHCFGLFLGLFTLDSSAAVVHCVSTAQEFQDALTKSSDKGQYSGDDNSIHLVATTYWTSDKSPPGAFTYTNSSEDGNLIIRGGYDAGCHTQTADPSLTLISGSMNDPVLDIGSTTASMEIAWVTIGFGNSSYGAGLLANNDTGQNGAVILHNTRILDNAATLVGGGIALSGGGASVHNNLFVGNSASQGSGAASIIGGSVYFYNNTVYRNTSGGDFDGGVDITCGDLSACAISNNILWDNTNLDLGLAGHSGVNGGHFNLAYNDIAEYGSSTSNIADLGTVFVSPKFVDTGDGDYRLDTGSALLGASPELEPGPDLDNKPYPTSGLTDIGAYEDTIYSGGFDPPLPIL